MPPIVNFAAAALLLQVLSLSCPQMTTSTAFVSQANLHFAYIKMANTRTCTAYSSTPPSREVIGSKRRRAVGTLGAVRGGDGDEAGGERKAPVTVLDRPWDVEVLLDGERRVITVQPGDSVLEAAEMSGMTVPYDCRRGNCISCAARVQEGSSDRFENRADRRSDDGAPEGFVLSCSTFPVGPGVKLELSVNAEMWTAFCTKFDDVNTRGLLRQASASVMRNYNVRHPQEFRDTIERQFESP